MFDLSKEKADLRDRYGRHTFGQDCLAARRLVEAGVPYVVINYPGGWDTHSNHFATMRRQCPQLDQGLAALLADLKDRGLLESTLVWCCGEFGRARRWTGNRPGTAAATITATSSRCWSPAADSRAATWSASSDAKAEEVKDRPVYPVDLLGSIYQLAGIDASRQAAPSRWAWRPTCCPPPEGVKSAGLLTEIM